ncbi:hypothetical protein SAMN04487948_1323 [Halogranum amylolyticum]|uniref:Uncharacterized protein n=1 Tax=Halogranum amylolyticum TaxID=660520 RepID=A0A1H8WK00_9EURY|nr:hypothetical protein [Halogranum amylolyticum]SEP27976.1 hypothetical protein SAMN04487948_1323 [Halogranum amylolyticum]
MTDADPGNTMRERVGNRRSRLQLYVQLNVNRLLFTLAVSLVFFVSILALSVFDETPLRVVMRASDPVETLFQGYLTAIITGVTLVVTISQLVLSQELGPLGDQRDRMEGAVEFRHRVEEFFDATPPPEPASFLQALIDMSAENAQELGETISDDHDEEFLEKLEGFLDELVQNAEAVSDELDDAQFGRYQVIKSALDYNYSWKIYQARRLRRDYAEELSEAEEAAFDDLTQVLEFFGPAREHFKTLYFEWELVDLSRKMLYVSVPALTIAVAMLIVVDPSTLPGFTFGIDNMYWIVIGAATVSSIPFFLLGAYMIRLATIARRTLAIGPFILRESGRTDAIDWES